MKNIKNFFSSSAKKKLPLMLAVTVLAIAVVSATVAFLIDSTNKVTNTFDPSSVDSSVEETVSGGVKSSVQIKNTGDINAYIRVAVIGNTVDESGNVTGPFDVSSCLAAAGWVKSGDYYYWTEPVAPKGLTGELLTGSIDLDGKQVTIVADAIQADPAKAVGEAWGVVIAENSVTPYSAG